MVLDGSAFYIHPQWSGLGLQTDYYDLIDVYIMDEERMLACSNHQNKMELIYETIDK